VKSHTLWHVAAYRGAAAALMALSEAAAGGRETGPRDAGADGQGMTPVMYAAGRGHLPCLNICLRLGMDAAAELSSGNALHCAAQGARYWYSGDRAIDEAVNWLARPAAAYRYGEPEGERDARRKAPDSIPRLPVPPPLDWEGVVTALHGAGLSVDHPNRLQQTPLMVALAHDNYPVVRALLLAGANITARDKHGKCVAAYADHTVTAAVGATPTGAREAIDHWLATRWTLYEAITGRINATTSSVIGPDWATPLPVPLPASVTEAGSVDPA